MLGLLEYWKENRYGIYEYIKSVDVLVSEFYLVYVLICFVCVDSFIFD